LVANDGADGSDRSFGLLQRLQDARDGQDWTDAGDGVAWSQQHNTCRQDRVDHTGSRFGLFNSREANRFHRVLIPALYEILFETKFANRSVNPCFNSSITHRQDTALNAHSCSDGGGNFGERLSFTK